MGTKELFIGTMVFIETIVARCGRNTVGSYKNFEVLWFDGIAKIRLEE